MMLVLSGALALGLLFPGATDVQAGPSARDIMAKVSLNRKLDGSEAVVKMTMYDAGGQARVRELTMATKLYDGGKTEKRIYRFLSPPDVKGTGILVFDYDNAADDVWVYLPALRKTRRIVSGQHSKSFMGSEFSYGDLNIPSLDDYTYTLVREEAAGGEACYVIDMVPKTPAVASSDGYSKKTYWVSKATHVVRKGLMYGPGGGVMKELTMGDVQLMDSGKGRYRAKRMEMVNKTNGRRSLFETTQVSFTPNTKDEYFTTRYLERP